MRSYSEMVQTAVLFFVLLAVLAFGTIQFLNPNHSFMM